MKLIKADDIRNYLIDKAHEAIDKHADLDPVDFIVDAVGFIDKLPGYPSLTTAHWVKDAEDDFYTCSRCGHIFKNDYDPENNPKFCFECGSRMVTAVSNDCIVSPVKKCDYYACTGQHDAKCCIGCKEGCAYPCPRSGRRPNEYE